jgi:hypothetical protein
MTPTGDLLGNGLSALLAAQLSIPFAIEVTR